MRRYLPIALVVAAAALIVALTSGGTSNAHKASSAGAQAVAGPYGAAPATAARPAASNSAIGIRTTPLGKILVDTSGRTLYLFQADKPNVRTLSQAGLAVWPAFTTTATPQAKDGANAHQINTITGPGSGRQVTYNGHPLYRYAGDQQPGDTNGQGLNQFGAKWYVLAASGNKIDGD
jgi:predicted lipoprotein with Yx(FWY)xxD motif